MNQSDVVSEKPWWSDHKLWLSLWTVGKKLSLEGHLGHESSETGQFRQTDKQQIKMTTYEENHTTITISIETDLI